MIRQKKISDRWITNTTFSFDLQKIIGPNRSIKILSNNRIVANCSPLWVQGLLFVSELAPPPICSVEAFVSLISLIKRLSGSPDRFSAPHQQSISCRHTFWNDNAAVLYRATEHVAMFWRFLKTPEIISITLLIIKPFACKKMYIFIYQHIIINHYKSFLESVTNLRRFWFKFSFS